MTYTKSMTQRRGRRAMGSDDPLDDLFALINSMTPAAEADPADKVNQTTGGGTSTSAADFTSVGGVCKPKNFPALAAARGLQGQLNRVAQMKGFKKVSPDGAIGPATLALFRQVQSVSAGAVMGDPTTCMGVAPDVDVLAGQVMAVADTLGAPATVPGPVFAFSLPTITTNSGKTVVAPDAGILGSLATLSTIEKLALAGVAGGIGYMLVTQGRKRRRR